jgi:hypothetical protein
VRSQCAGSVAGSAQAVNIFAAVAPAALRAPWLPNIGLPIPRRRQPSQ